MNLSSDIATFKRTECRDDLLPIIDKMMPAINKYKRSLHFIEDDDAKQELIISLIISVKKIKKYDNEYQCLSYLNRALHIKYLELCHIYIPQKESKTTIEIDIDSIEAKNNITYSNVELYYDLFNALENLSTYQKKILYLVLIKNLTDEEIAYKYAVSRQYINRIKKKAFRDLKKYLHEN